MEKEAEKLVKIKKLIGHWRKQANEIRDEGDLFRKAFAAGVQMGIRMASSDLEEALGEE